MSNVDMMDMALDDAIKQDRASKTDNNAGRRRRGPRRGLEGTESGADSSREEGRVGKVRSRNGSRRSSPYARPGSQSKNNTDGKWRHDLYSGDRQPREGRGAKNGGGTAFSVTMNDSSTGPKRISIENLHYEVVKADLEELFNQIGPVTKVHLRYDRAGRSTGVAEVTFERAGDARSAVNEYNNVTLDGRPMRITLTSENGRSSGTSSIANRIGSKPSNSDTGNRKRENRPPRNSNAGSGAKSSGNQNRNGRNGRNGRGRSGGKREPTNPMTAEELDAQLDTYMQLDRAEATPTPTAAQ